MEARLAIIGHRSSQPVVGTGGTPIGLTETALPASEESPAATRLIRSIEDALREMRVRQRQVPGDATSPLRLGLIAVEGDGTSMNVHTGSANLRSLDLGTAEGRETALGELRDLEQEFLSED